MTLFDIESFWLTGWFTKNFQLFSPLISTLSSDSCISIDILLRKWIIELKKNILTTIYVFFIWRSKKKRNQKCAMWIFFSVKSSCIWRKKGYWSIKSLSKTLIWFILLFFYFIFVVVTFCLFTNKPNNVKLI